MLRSRRWMDCRLARRSSPDTTLLFHAADPFSLSWGTCWCLGWIKNEKIGVAGISPSPSACQHYFPLTVVFSSNVLELLHPRDLLRFSNFTRITLFSLPSPKLCDFQRTTEKSGKFSSILLLFVGLLIFLNSSSLAILFHELTLNPNQLFQ